MMTVSLSDFSRNVDYYVQTASHSQITVEKDGVPYFHITPLARTMSKEEKIAAIKKVVGILPSDLDFDKVKTEAILEK